MGGYPFSHKVRVRFAETDAQGIAHRIVLVWMEEARVAYLAAFAGGYRAIRDRGVEALTTGVHVEYERAAVFDDVLTIRVRCGEIRGARFRYEYVVERDGVAWPWPGRRMPPSTRRRTARRAYRPGLWTTSLRAEASAAKPVEADVTRPGGLGRRRIGPHRRLCRRLRAPPASAAASSRAGRRSSSPT